MYNLLQWKTWLWGGLLWLMLASGGWAQSSNREELLKALGSSSLSDIAKAVEGLGQLNDPTILPALEALRDKRLRVSEAGVIVIVEANEQNAKDLLTGQPVSLEGTTWRTPTINNAIRRALQPLLGQLQLNSPDPNARKAAVQELINRPTAAAIEPLKALKQQEKVQEIQELIATALALTQLQSPNLEEKLAALQELGNAGNSRFKEILQNFLKKNAQGEYLEKEAVIRQAAQEAIKSIETRETMTEFVGNFFRGVSLGSILLLASLGLAITFGLMRVINMAHGEMLMIGAYSTYITQNFFLRYAQEYFAWYLLAAIPIAFLITTLLGMILERGVIRFLYGRPLETLLATWGISLMLIQSVRLIFGAQNVEVANPQWLSGGFQAMQGLVLPYNRIAIIFFVIFVMTLVWFLLQKTSLGLKVRAVTQNRAMASCLGISSARTDMWTFGLGSGIAGLGGVALSQIGNVGPELGQGYIVDAFMVVVLGGVGKLSGTIVSALGLGLVNKYLEPFAGAVVAKILVLIFIILFIQKRPQGLFAPKGRTLNDE